MTNHTKHTLSDTEIIDLYWARDEEAIRQTDHKYRAYLLTIAENILNNMQDSEECLDDTYIAAWNSMPPKRPNVLKAFLSTIMRRQALLLYRNSHRQKRQPQSQALSLSDLEGIVGDQGHDYTHDDVIRLALVLESYIDSLDEFHRYVFLSRFYYGKPIAEIANTLGIHRAKVNRAISHIRYSLRAMLEEEGIGI